MGFDVKLGHSHALEILLSGKSLGRKLHFEAHFFHFFFACIEIMCIFVPSFGTFCSFHGGGWTPERPRERSALSSFMPKSPNSIGRMEEYRIRLRYATYACGEPTPCSSSIYGVGVFRFFSFPRWCLAIPVTR